MTEVYLAPGLRTPFVKGGAAFAQFDALTLAAPVAKAMAERARPDVLVWSQVIPDATVTNIARELIFAAELDPTIPAFTTVLACSSSFVGVISAAGMIGKGGMGLALEGRRRDHEPCADRPEGACRRRLSPPSAALRSHPNKRGAWAVRRRARRHSPAPAAPRSPRAPAPRLTVRRR
jgi:hypothetical protein